MKHRIANAAIGITGAVIAAALVGALVFSHSALHPRASFGIGTAASAAATDTPSPTPTDVPTPALTPTAAPTTQPAAPAPTPPQVATVSSPLPSPSPSPVQAPLPPSPTPDPSAPPPPPPSPTPPPVCSWSVVVSTQTSAGTWSDLGTWTGSAATATSPIFITGVSGWLRYTYQFTAACIGHAALASTYVNSGSAIYSDSITTTSAETREANVPHNTQVDFTVTVQ